MGEVTLSWDDERTEPRRARSKRWRRGGFYELARSGLRGMLTGPGCSRLRDGHAARVAGVSEVDARPSPGDWPPRHATACGSRRKRLSSLIRSTASPGGSSAPRGGGGPRAGDVRARVPQLALVHAGTNLRAWLLRILTNLNIDRGRRKQRSPEMQPLEEGDYFLYNRLEESSREPALRPGRASSSGSRRTTSSARSPAVPHDFRDVIVLVDIGDFTYQDAAQILDIPIGTVMSRLHRGQAYPEDRSSQSRRWRAEMASTIPATSARSVMQPFLDRELDDAERARGRGASRRLLVLPQALPLRGEPARFVRESLRRGDAAGAEAEARGAADASLAEALRQVFRPVDVAGRAEVVARHEHGVERACALVRDARPRPRGRARPGGRARRRRSLRRTSPPPRAPGGDDRGRPPPARGRARRRGRRPRPSASRGARARPQRSEAPGPRSQSGQRTTRASVSSSYAPATTTTSPTSAACRTRRAPSASSSALLRRAEARRGAGREHDGGDHELEIAMCLTTTTRVGLPPDRSRRRACRSSAPRAGR